jgi:hypothetical protein
MIRDGNGTRSFETLLRYRGAAMAEFWRALRTLKALQAEQAAEAGPALDGRPLAAHRPEAHQMTPVARPPLVQRPQPDEPERRLDYALPEPPARAPALHEPAAPWLPNEPEPRQKSAAAPAGPGLGPKRT